MSPAVAALIYSDSWAVAAREGACAGIARETADLEYHGFNPLRKRSQVTRKAAYATVFTHFLERWNSHCGQHANDHDHNHDFNEVKPR